MIDYKPVVWLGNKVAIVRKICLYSSYVPVRTTNSENCDVTAMENT